MPSKTKKQNSDWRYFALIVAKGKNRNDDNR
jgi:hypothetical protein